MGNKLSKKKNPETEQGTAANSIVPAARRSTVGTPYKIQPLMEHRRRLAPALTEAIVALQFLNEVHVTPQHVPPLWPMVRWAVLERGLQPTSSWIEKVHANFPQLTTITFPTHITTNTIVNFVSARPQMASITVLSGRDRGQSLSASLVTPDSYFSLHTLVLRKCNDVVTLKTIASLYHRTFEATARTSALVVLDVSASSCEAASLAQFASACSGLKRLNLSHTSWMYPTVMNVVSQLPLLEDLDLSGLHGITVLDLADLGLKCPCLTNLGLAGWRLAVGVTPMNGKMAKPVDSPDFETIISRCTKLTSLDISTSALKLLPREHSVWRRMSCLRRLSMRCGVATNALMLDIAQFTTTLRRLDVRAAADLDDRGVIAALKHCPRLVEVGLGAIGEGITDATMFALASCCRELEVLDVSGCQVTDEGVAALAKGCRYLTSLNVSDMGGRVTDASLHVVADQCAGLVHLDVSNSQRGLTNVGIEYIAERCFALQRLNLSFNGLLSLAALLKFQDSEVLLEVLDLNGCTVFDPARNGETVTDSGRLNSVALVVIGV